MSTSRNSCRRSWRWTGTLLRSPATRAGCAGQLERRSRGGRLAWPGGPGQYAAVQVRPVHVVVVYPRSRAVRRGEVPRSAVASSEGGGSRAELAVGSREGDAGVPSPSGDGGIQEAGVTVRVHGSARGDVAGRG